jgi:2-polyprenyl-6-hydroxyphenyl methylase / 3-demethylubiquinone-9 3-methyltransferase
MPTRLNTDARETQKFGRLANGWWDSQGPMRSLHAINGLRTSFIAGSLDLRGRRVLDVGCGGGLLAESLARHGARVTGLDLAEPLVTLAIRHAAEQHLPVEYRCMAVEQLAEERPLAFDIVTCMEFLEHVPRPQEAVLACANLLKPQGHAFFATLDRSPRSFLFAIIGAEYVLRLLPRGSHTYRRLIRPAELAAWCGKANLRLVSSAGVIYNVLTRKFNLATRPDISYMMHFMKD